ncbi:hypothetical protein BAX51_02340 [Mycoplasmoides gallisepticum]|uniref:hypothetical protein n=1 Tax=Mycoplasmoides gallisepticum TaxID=2096 RepID=UPI0007EFB49D|nr:hypothetical protein [Mycoplasmoides gallisepticum]OBU79320.1 hypothetical protein BAY37_01195 [Mycoplasmoides gallisepticum]OBU80592.1 hypothetical protein BAX51_02340 [Mycoplasmoides gallisepticum]OBU80888.1 hypothetical protein BAX53_01315 [Mycoplasmoides gallisepticum]OBU80921.1 hypothetical protein BAX52_00140 [Mycoplasmoides gallisepticum]OBZ53138.1 hypothetical protein BBF99_02450 [Mycoplasmoides gallisepticum]
MFIRKIFRLISFFFISLLGLFNLNIGLIKENKIVDYKQSLHAENLTNNADFFYDDLNQTAQAKTIKIFLTDGDYQSVLLSLMLTQYFLNDDVVDDKNSPVVFLYQQQLVNDIDFSINVASNITNWFQNNYPQNQGLIETNNSTIFANNTNISYTSANVLTFLDLIRIYFHNQYINDPQLVNKPLLFDIFISPQLLTTIWDNQSLMLYNFLPYLNKFHVIANTNYLKTVFFRNYAQLINNNLINFNPQQVLINYQDDFKKIFVNAKRHLESNTNNNNDFNDGSIDQISLDTFKKTPLYQLVYNQEKFLFYDGVSYQLNNTQVSDALRLNVRFYHKIYELFFNAKRLMLDPTKVPLLIKQYLNIFLVTDQYNVSDYIYKNRTDFDINKKTFVFLEPLAPSKLNLNELNSSNTITNTKFDEYKSILATFRKIYPDDRYNFIYLTNVNFDGFKNRFDSFQQLLELNDAKIIYTKPISGYFFFYELWNEYQRNITSNVDSSIILGGVDYNDDNVLEAYDFLTTNTSTRTEQSNLIVRNINNFPVPLTFLINDFEPGVLNPPAQYFLLNSSYVTVVQGLINETLNTNQAVNLIGSKRFFDDNNYTSYDPIQAYNRIISQERREISNQATIPIILVVFFVLLIGLVGIMMIFIIYNYKKLRRAQKSWSAYIAKFRKEEDNNHA